MLRLEATQNPPLIMVFTQMVFAFLLPLALKIIVLESLTEQIEETVSAFEYLKNMVTHYINRNILIKI